MADPRQDTALSAGPSASRFLDAWEIGRRQSPTDRTMTVIAADDPDRDRRALERLTIGERDRHLINLRRRLFGECLRGQTACPTCGESLEFTLRTDDILIAPGERDADEPARGEVRAEGYEIAFRAPDCRDLAFAAAAGTVAGARRALLDCCVIEARRDGEAINAGTLPEPIVARLAQGIAERDPQAEILIDLVCPACNGEWPLHFDIAGFLWEEVSAWVQHLLRDVHTLAAAYGWSEADILAMSTTRRRLYRELLGE